MAGASLKRLLERFDGGHGLAGGAGLAFGIRVAGAGFGFALSIVLARSLGPADTGVYFLAVTVVGVAALFGRLGLENALLRLVAVAAGAGDWAQVKAIARAGVGHAAFASLITAAALFITAPWLASQVFAKPALADPLRWMAVSIGPMALVVLYGEMLKALGRVRDAQLVQSFIMPLCSLGVFALYFRQDGLIGAIYAFLTGIGVTWLVGLGLWRMNTPQLRAARSARSPPLLRVALPFMSIQAMNTVNEWMDVLVLGMFAPAEEVGVYAIAKRFTVIVGFVLIAVNSVAAPRFAQMHARGDAHGLNSLAVSAARLSLVAAGPLLLLCLAAPQWVMSLFGEDFQRGAVVLLILSLGQLVNVATGSAGQLLAMAGRERTLHNLVLFSMLCNLILMFSLVPYLGMVGMAIAVAVAVAIENLLKLFYVTRCLGINCHIFAARNIC